MNSKTFDEALGMLKLGHIPPNVEEVRQYAAGAISETMQAFDAVFACMVRLDASNQMLRKAVKSTMEQNKTLRDRVENLEMRLEAATDY